MLVTVCGYEQNPSRGVGGVAHTGFRVVRTDRRPYGLTNVRRSANLNAHPQVCGGGGGWSIISVGNHKSTPHNIRIVNSELG